MRVGREIKNLANSNDDDGNEEATANLPHLSQARVNQPSGPHRTPEVNQMA